MVVTWIGPTKQKKQGTFWRPAGMQVWLSEQTRHEPLWGLARMQARLAREMSQGTHLGWSW